MSQGPTPDLHDMIYASYFEGITKANPSITQDEIDYEWNRSRAREVAKNHPHSLFNALQSLLSGEELYLLGTMIGNRLHERGDLQNLSKLSQRLASNVYSRVVFDEEHAKLL